MATRSMRDAHAKIYLSLDNYCAEHQNPIKNAGAVRWTPTSDARDKDWLISAKFLSEMSFAESMKIARFEHKNISYFCSVGLDLPENIGLFSEVEVGGGMWTAIVSELMPLPRGSTSEIRNVIEVEDKDSNPDYSGHSFELVEKLFPEIRCFSVEDLSEDETDRIFFLICLASASHRMLWMKRQLYDTLNMVVELSPKAIPYRTLCRSVFDTDPSSLFMALYRCLEALYAYSHTTKLMERLDIEKPWTDIAMVLEETLGWRPREESSLGALLDSVVKNDLRAVLEAIGESVAANEDFNNRATKRIYNLRNSLVHYRPFHQSFKSDKVNWNKLCEAMALLVLHAYDSVVKK